jgi:predicted MPP superfamily phosphohydrolase
LLIALRAGWWEPSSLRVSSYTVPQSSPALKGLRIAVISDLHGGSAFIDVAKIDRVVAMTNAAKPDLILLTGDYVISHVLGGHHMAIETIVAQLKGLHAPLGVYAVLGNHDRWEDAENIARVLRQAGIPVLENTHVMLPEPRSTISLVGIGDRSSGAARPRRALAGVSGTALCFTHSPDIFPRLRPTCALTIAGHTHGGQIWLPFFGRPAVAVIASRYGQKYAIGVVHEDNKTLFVSPGIGTSGLPLRLGVPPEISLLTIQ